MHENVAPPLPKTRWEARLVCWTAGQQTLLPRMGRPSSADLGWAWIPCAIGTPHLHEGGGFFIAYGDENVDRWLQRCFWEVVLVLLIFPGIAVALEANRLGDVWWLGQAVDWFLRGGPVMYPILACSIIGLAVFLERLVFLRRTHLLPQRFVRGVMRAWQRGELDVAWDLCHQYDVPLARVLRVGLLKVKEGAQETERAIEARGSHEVALLTANLRFLGAISNIAPLLGFLGTVTGLISAFNVIALHGTGDPKLLADGVSEALITTEFGLFIGIPALGAYHYLRGKVDSVVYEMQDIALQLLHAMQFPHPGDAGGDAREIPEGHRGRL